MKAYRGTIVGRAHKVDVVETDKYGRVTSMALNQRTDLRALSNSGFSWGDHSMASAQLALGILCDALGSEGRALKLYQSFKSRVIACLPQEQNWLMTVNDVIARVQQLENEREGACQ